MIHRLAVLILLLTAGTAGISRSEATELTPVDLGAFAAGEVSYSIAVNNLGQVAGVTFTPEGARHAFFWSAEDGMVDLGTLGGSCATVDPVAISERGHVVGSCLTFTGEELAFSWTASAGMVGLDLGGGHSRAVAVNSSGQVLGYSLTEAGEGHAFLWAAEDGMVDLSPGEPSYPSAINETGQVVGRSSGAFLWTQAGGMVDIGDFDPVEINDLGQVLGTTGFRAVLWTKAGGLIDLGTLGGSTSYPVDLNELGEVLGNSETSDGRTHPFFWTAAAGTVDIGTLGGGQRLGRGPQRPRSGDRLGLPGRTIRVLLDGGGGHEGPG